MGAPLGHGPTQPREIPLFNAVPEGLHWSCGALQQESHQDSRAGLAHPMQSLAIIYPLQHYQLKQLHNPYLPTNAWLAERVLTRSIGGG